jgi:hypothetical protein
MSLFPMFLLFRLKYMQRKKLLLKPLEFADKNVSAVANTPTILPQSIDYQKHNNSNYQKDKNKDQFNK